MTNPGNAIGTNGAFNGRTSPNALNDVLSAFEGRGILSGWACTPQGGLAVALGGDGANRDVAIAMDDSGNKLTVNNISGSPVEVTLPAVPSVGQRIDLIVAYVNNPPQGSATEMDNPEACGIVVVSGAPVAQNPSAPADSDIRSAITADGASGNTAYYVILVQVQVAAGMTDVVASNITAGEKALNNKISIRSYGITEAIDLRPNGGSTKLGTLNNPDHKTCLAFIELKYTLISSNAGARVYTEITNADKAFATGNIQIVPISEGKNGASTLLVAQMRPTDVSANINGSALGGQVRFDNGVVTILEF